MPVNPSSFSLHRPYYSGAAYLQIKLIGHAQTNVTIGALLDSGAAHSVFDEQLVRNAGYDPSQLPTIPIRLADGRLRQFRYLGNAPIEVEGTRIVVPRLLLSSGIHIQLIAGQDALLATEYAFGANAIFFD